MSSSDWWAPSGSTSASFHTPQRSAFGGASASTRARFAGDELDPEDAQMAESIKFQPAFSASSPLNRFGVGASPGATTSPGGNRRSPNARFSLTPGDSTSPRRSMRSNHFAMDEDLPPTQSLRDFDQPSSSASAPIQQSAVTGQLPTPASLTPNRDTTTLLVFGPPPEQLGNLRPQLEEVGTVVSYRPGAEGTSWWVVEYDTPTSASQALRRHGETVTIGGRAWMIGFKVISGSAASVSTEIGSALRVQSSDIMKPKATVGRQETADGGAWGATEKPQGVVGKTIDWLFG